MKHRSFITPQLRPTLIGSNVAGRIASSAVRSHRGSPLSCSSILVIAAEQDETALYFHQFALTRGYESDFLYVEDLASLNNFRWQSGDNAFMERQGGVYLRLPTSRDTRLCRTMAVIADILVWYPGPVIGRPSRRPLNISKPLQTAAIAMTADCAVRAVPTRVMNVPGGMERVRHGTLIVKSISSARSEVVLLTDARLLGESHLMRCPVQIQPRLYGVNIRVHVCGEQVVAGEIHSDALDYRYGAGFTMEPAGLPTEVVRLCIMAAACEGLEFAGVDLFREATSHQYYCLEINPSPAYHYFEKRLLEAREKPIISEWLLARLTTPFEQSETKLAALSSGE